MQEGVVAFGVEDEEPLVEQHVDRLLARALDHELGARLAQDSRSVVDELAGICLDPQVDAAFAVGRRSALGNRDSSRAVI